MTSEPIVPDKIRLLMEETACDRAEAELAMSLAGFDLEKAIRTIGTILRHIVVVKGKFADPHQNLYGLLLLIADRRKDHFIRARAVVSYNPVLYETPLSPHWYDFERALYAARLAEGTLQQVSQELERSLLEGLDARRDEFFSSLKSPSGTNLAGVLNEGITKTFPRGVVSVFSPEVIDWNQFRRFPIKGDDRSSAPRSGTDAPSGGGVYDPVDESPSEKAKGGDTLRLAMKVVEDPAGRPVKDVRFGDHVTVALDDGRDIARYVVKLVGAFGSDGTRPIEAPVETADTDLGRTRLHVRLSAGILGVAETGSETLVKVSPRENDPWWRRFFSTSR